MTDACVSVSGVSYAYGPKQALSDVAFEIPSGQFCALLGPNGAGKSTLFALLTRLVVTAQGRIEVGGHDLTQAPRAALSKIGVVFQQSTIDLDLSVYRNLRYFCALHGIAGRDADRRIDRALDQVDMRERKRERARSLNGGHRRRMEIARSLMHDPAVLLLDEPTVGLDTASRQSITDHVHDLTDSGIGVLWATHLVDEVRDEDGLVILHKGQVLQHGNARSLRGEQSLGDHFTALTGGDS